MYCIYSRLIVGVNFAVRGTSIIFWVITWVFQFKHRSINYSLIICNLLKRLLDSSLKILLPCNFLNNTEYT